MNESTFVREGAATVRERAFDIHSLTVVAPTLAQSSRLVHPRRRGVILVVAMWVMVILVGLVIVMARQARVESIASGNRLAKAQAAMAARAAEQYVLSEVQNGAGDADVIAEAPGEAIAVGDAYFWIIRPDPQNEQYYDFGITDEAGKVDINAANRDMLLKLPGMTDELVDAIIDWRDADSETSTSGAENDYYGSQPQPYQCKNGPFESMEELTLVRGFLPEVMWNYDLNHNGILDINEAAGGGGGMGLSTSDSANRGLAPFFTIYGGEQGQADAAATPGQGGTGGSGGTGGTGSTGGSGSTGGQTGSAASTTININAQNSQALLDLLRNTLSSQRFSDVQGRIQSGRPFGNVIDFYYKTGLTLDEFNQVSGRLGTGGRQTGLINVNTAPLEVLRCLPGLEDNDAQTLLSARTNGGADLSGIGWITEALSREKAIGIGGAITGRSTRYSADIVGVSGNGRAYCRIRIIVDATSGTPQVVYRRDLTDTGWPLPQEVRDQLRAGTFESQYASLAVQR